ncbi:MAG: nodulation protein NfeD, partial [Pseudomonadota bacterium]|nr:nodulation protein NfeD [Pseudomonadota bacterium]
GLYLLIPVLLIAGLLLNNIFANSENSAKGAVIQLSIEGGIGPATDDYIERTLESAIESGAELVIIQMDTPGGLDSAMRGIIKNIANSTVPIASYVAPSGARAASAGTYILYASHIAAMAPGTNVGAATPVQIGGISPPSPQKIKKDKPANDNQSKDQPEDGVSEDASKQKIINDAVAYIQGLAQLRGRNPQWAEKAVREAASLPANDALKLNVIDIVATSMDDLLQQIDGREVVIHGVQRTLNTSEASIIQIVPDWRSRLLSVITNPNVAYILMLIGVYGLILEFYNPGAILPGTIGAISLLLALYAFQLLPINYAGIGLILLGIALMVGEAFEPSFGVLGIGGVISFVIGSIILIDTDAPGYGIDISIIITFAVTSVLIFIVVVGLALKSRRRPVVSGLEELIGGEAIVVNDFDHQGTVIIHSEHWQALSDTPLHKSQQVKVTGIKGLTLIVEPLDSTISENTV